VVVVHSPVDWRPEQVQRILVPVGGQTGHDPLRARLLGMFRRYGQDVEVTFLRLLRPDQDRERAESELQDLAADLGYGPEQCALESAEDPAGRLIERSREADLLILGMGGGRTGARISPFLLRVARDAACPLIAIGHPQ